MGLLTVIQRASYIGCRSISMAILTGQVWTHITSCQVVLSVPQVCVIRKRDSHGLETMRPLRYLKYLQ